MMGGILELEEGARGLVQVIVVGGRQGGKKS